MKEKCACVSRELAIKMAVLSNCAYRVFNVLLFNVRRNGSNLLKASNPFNLSYERDVEPFGVSRNGYTRSLKELSEKEFIKINGSYSNKLCKILIW